MSDWLAKYVACPDCRVERTYVQVCEAHSLRKAFDGIPIGNRRGLPEYTPGDPSPARLGEGAP